MATNAITLFGTVVTYNSNTIGELMSISGSRTMVVHPIFTADSTGGAVEKIAGALDEGSVTCHIVYDGSAAGVYNDLNTDYLARTFYSLVITFSDTSSITCSAIITNLGTPSGSEGSGPMELDVTFEISGTITYADVA